MQSIRKTSLKATCYTIYHVTIATLIFSAVIYLITGEWEHEYFEKMGFGLIGYLVLEIVGYSVFEIIWPRIEMLLKKLGRRGK